jgi:hypothetical protein
MLQKRLVPDFTPLLKSAILLTLGRCHPPIRHCDQEHLRPRPRHNAVDVYTTTKRDDNRSYL